MFFFMFCGVMLPNEITMGKGSRLEWERHIVACAMKQEREARPCIQEPNGSYLGRMTTVVVATLKQCIHMRRTILRLPTVLVVPHEILNYESWVCGHHKQRRVAIELPDGHGSIHPVVMDGLR
jgi:hypothetical protein